MVSNQGLKFFGEINASISHEIKNVLSIINENAGLLEDFTLLADKGHPLDPERLKTLAKMIQKQVKRADGIIKNMNIFAHSVDESDKIVDLGEILRFVSVLTARLTANRGLRLEILSPQQPVTLTADPFFLINLIWLCIDFSANWAGDGKTIAASPEQTSEGVAIKLSGLEGLSAAAPGEIAPDKKLQALLDDLNVRLTIPDGAKSLVFMFTKGGQ